MTMDMLVRRMKVGKATVHGFRSTFRDWAGDRTDFPREVAEEALSHKVGNAVERTYRRRTALEKRRELMEAWALYLSGEKKEPPAEAGAPGGSEGSQPEAA
jgi:integrase